MQIYGITFDHTVNYGSCLQAYALQTAIENILINGCPVSYALIPFSKIRSTGRAKGMKQKFMKCLRQMQWRAFDSFDSKYMHYARISSINELKKLNDYADAFVCGSDVIWNSAFVGTEKAFYLNFAQKYKFSYAASFGRFDTIIQSCQENRELLERFNTISVRESSAKDILEKMIEKEISVVLDPVLLLTKDEWRKITVPKNKTEKFIFVYTTYPSDILQNVVKRLHKQTGMRVISIAWSGGVGENLRQVEKWNLQPPDDWLWYIQNAEYVVTNSFHGTAFSVLFHKQVYTVVKGQKKDGNNIRLFDFLVSVGLEKQIITEVSKEISIKSLDFTKADSVITKQRIESLTYLRSNLEAAARIKQNRLVQER